MKTILDSIIKVEQDIQQKIMEARKESEDIIETAKEKIILVERGFRVEFEEEKKNKIEKINEKAEKYSIELMKKVETEMSRKKERINKDKEKLKQKMINIILEKK